MILISILVKTEMKGLNAALRRTLSLILREAEPDEKLGYPFSILCAETYPIPNRTTILSQTSSSGPISKSKPL